MNASEIKAKFAISYADCFAAATALKFSAAIITEDPEFKKVYKNTLFCHNQYIEIKTKVLTKELTYLFTTKCKKVQREN